MSEEAIEAPSAEPLGYATPTRGGVAGVGFALIFGGLGLILLGGCFLIGVMIIANITSGVSFNGLPRGMSVPQMLLTGVLYVASFASFGGGAWLIVLSVRTMLGRGTGR